MRYFWRTVELCVPPEVIQDELAADGFVDVACDTDLAVFRAYRARKPDQLEVCDDERSG